MKNTQTNVVTEELKFPVTWHGSLLMHSPYAEGTADAARQIMQSLGIADGVVTDGAISSTGRFVTFRVDCTVNDRATLNSLFHALESIPGLRMLL